jgi:L-galactose dehydrogenase
MRDFYTSYRLLHCIKSADQRHGSGTHSLRQGERDRADQCSGLHMGVLTEGGAPQWHTAPAGVQEMGRKLATLFRDRSIDISNVALRYCFDHSYVSCTLVGMSKAAQVIRNLEILRANTDPKFLAELRQVTAPVFNYFWPSGHPENHA